MNKPFLSFLREVLVVVIGILIAVVLNDFQTKRTDQRYLKKAMSAIEEEVKDARLSVSEVVERHSITIDSLERYAEDSIMSLAEFLERAGGIQLATTGNVGLRFYVAGKADLLDLELVSKLADVEVSTQVLRGKMDRLLDFTYGRLTSTDAESKLLFAMHLGNVMDSETALLEHFDEVLEMLQGPEGFPEQAAGR